MSDKTLKIFQLCDLLCNLLGDKEAIADLNLLYEIHPEMFENMQEVSNVISQVIENQPHLIVNNPKAKNDRDFIVGKQLNDKKMGEVGIRKDSGISKIFHANQKRLKNLDLLAKKDIVFDGRDAHTPYTQAQSLDGRLVQTNISSNDDIISQDSNIKEQSLNNNMLEIQAKKLKMEIQEIKAKDPNSPLLESKRRELTNIQKSQAKTTHKDSSKPKPTPKKSQGQGRGM